MNTRARPFPAFSPRSNTRPAGRLRRACRAALSLLCLTLTVTAGTGEAQVLLSCVSVRLLPATVRNLGQTYRLEATTLTGGGINDEIGPFASDDSPRWYGTYLVYTDSGLFDSMPIWCNLDVPDPGDSNRNGVWDFFEADLGLANARSDGEFVLADGFDTPGTVDLVWARPAGSTAGTCTLALRIPDYGVQLTFTHAFEILDYRGTLTYSVHGTDIPSSIALNRFGALGALQGPWPLTRIDQDELAFGAAGWTNELGDVLQVYGSEITEITLFRGARGTNYYTTLITDDGLPSTPAQGEYQIWTLNIFDGNDRDRDRVADLSDDPPPPSPPQLQLRRAGPTILGRIAGEVGQSVTLEQTPALPATAWTAVQTLTLTNLVQEVDLGPPSSPCLFWRARTP